MHVLTVDFTAPNAAELFTQSLRETGFAVLKNHPVSADLIFSAYNEWKDFFADPEEKQKYMFDREKQDGYFPPEISETAKGYTVKDLKEYYQIYPDGRYPSSMSNKTRQLYNELSQIAITLLQWVEDFTPESISKDFSIPLSQMIVDSSKTMLRILHYPPLQGNEDPDAIRAAAHEDINLITVLPAATTPGLQVLDSAGNWHEVSCDPGTLVVNTGDMLQMCSQHYYRSTTHRVVNPHTSKNEARLSMPLFLHPRNDVRLSATHTASEYLMERLKELGVY